MTNLKFKVQGQIIQKIDDNDVVEKSRNEYNAVFEFSDDWIDIENKQAYFTRYKDGFCVKADIDENGICKVPWEVTELPMFYVSVAGGDLKTVTRASVFVEQTGYSEDAEKSGTVPEVIRTPQSISLQDGMLLLLDKNGEAVGDGVTLPKQAIDAEISDTSENPVQNKVAKAYTDEKTKNRVLFEATITKNTRTVFIDKDLNGKYFNLSQYSVLFLGRITPNTPFYLNSFYTLSGKQYLTCYSGAHTTDGSKNILFHLHVRKDGVLLKGVFPDSIIETADTDLITGGSFSTKAEKSTCAYASTFADSGIKNITFGVRTSGVDMLEGSRIIITGVDL